MNLKYKMLTHAKLMLLLGMTCGSANAIAEMVTSGNHSKNVVQTENVANISPSDVVQAVTRKDYALLDSLKAKHFNFDIAEDLITPLGVAGFNCDSKMVNYLLSAGANPDFTSPQGKFRYTAVESAMDPGFDKTLPECKETLAILKSHSHETDLHRQYDSAKHYLIYLYLAEDLSHDAYLSAKAAGARIATQLSKEGKAEIQEFKTELKLGSAKVGN